MLRDKHSSIDFALSKEFVQVFTEEEIVRNPAI